MAVDLDPVDLKILTLLSKDGRLPAAQLADHVGLSRPAVSERIENGVKLERNMRVAQPDIFLRYANVLGEGAVTVDADANSVGAEMALPGQASKAPGASAPPAAAAAPPPAAPAAPRAPPLVFGKKP